MPITFFWIFLGSMAVGMPIVFALAFAPLMGFVLDDKTLFFKMLPQRIFGGINQFPLLAIPLFVLAGEIMNTSGITENLVRFARVLVGHFRAGLAQVNIVASMLFAGLSGSAVADTSAIGSIMIPAMERDGYTRAFSAAVTAASSVIGPIIPPSIIMIIYAFIMKVSVAGLFLAGFVPGILIGVGLMVLTKVLGERRNYPKSGQRASAGEIWSAFKGAFWPLLTPIIIIGGILSGVFTPTESAGAACFYALVLSIFFMRTLPLSEIPQLFLRTGLIASTILLIVGTSSVFGWGRYRLRRAPGARQDLVHDIREPHRVAVADQRAAVDHRHVPRRRSRHPDPRPGPGPDAVPARGRPAALRHHHVHQRDRGLGHGRRWA